MALYEGYGFYATLDGRTFKPDRVHKITGFQIASDHRGKEYKRIIVGDSGWFGLYKEHDEVYDRLAVGQSFKEDSLYSGHSGGREDYVVLRIVPDGSSSSTEVQSNSVQQTGQENMQGKVYIAAVVQTKTVPAGEGVVGPGVQVSEIVFSRPAFVSPSDAIASAETLAQAVNELKDKGFNPSDPTKPVEVKLLPFGNV